ncbi:MAG: MFS transporter [Propionibacteriaceae bacterium]|nr:MFS transporter [Propionibacteriaceae bacterium]
MAAGFGPYRTVLSDPRARAFSLAGVVARLPMSMTGLSIVLLVSLESGSFGRAGLITACGTVSGAVTAPLWGRRIDRVGQARVLIPAALICNLSLIALVVAVLLELPLLVILAAAVGAGLGFSSAGSCVRARWSQRLSHDPLLNTAYAWEAVLDEVVFIVGPVLATFLATRIHPALGLISCVVLGLVGAFALAGMRDSQPPLRPAGPLERARTPLSAWVLAPIVIASASLGALFGGMEVVVVAFAKEAGVLSSAGFIVMAWATGSLIAGILTGTLQWKVSPARRFRVGAVLLACSVLPLPFAGSPLLVTGLLLLSGLAIAPTLIASVAVTQAAVSQHRLTEALSWTSMGLAAGVAAGAAGLGYVIDLSGARAGFWGVVGIGVLLITAALCVQAPRRAEALASGPEPSGEIRSR